MPLLWGSHQGPDKRGTHNNLLLEAPQWDGDQTLPRVCLLLHNDHIIGASALLLIPKQLFDGVVLVSPPSWLYSEVQIIKTYIVDTYMCEIKKQTLEMIGPLELVLVN